MGELGTERQDRRGKEWRKLEQALFSIGVKPWEPWEQMTLREALFMHDAHVLDSWDHTAMVASNVYNVSVTVSNANGGKAKARSMTYFHPYRRNQRSGMRVNADNIQTLRQLFGAFVGGRKRG